ncbi:hypothetical protein GCM10027185_15190 [Spirosoma pulveris]
MSQNNLSHKRQLLADLFTGNTDSLQQYRASQQQAMSPYRWIVNDTVAGTVYGVGKDGSQHPLTSNALAEAPPNIVFQIVDHSCCKRIPEPDEDYH